jgi:starch phosphorylase
MPEALETWPVEIIENVLPRHMQIIFEINKRFLDRIEVQHPGDMARMGRMSLIAEGPERRVRMAHLAIVGSHSTNGVSELHSRIVRDQVFTDFSELWPERFSNKTNGITPRRFLLQANPELAALITRAIGDAWITDLTALHALEEHAENEGFQREWLAIRRANKERLAGWLGRRYGFDIDPATLFDIQVKRIHEYKRQLLNVLHVITLYNRLRDNPASVEVPRTVLIGGKSAPSYTMAKLIIKLANSVGDAINQDARTRRRLRLYFVPNYCVSTAEKLVGAGDLSEQISTAGMEASGTGNMKFALNGALIIGTLDGANIEIMEEIGPDNIFIFGRAADEVRRLRATGYNARSLASQDPDLSLALGQLGDGTFSPGQPDLFKPIVESLLDRGDYFMLCADFRSYIECQERVTRAYLEEEEWTRRSILSVARMGRFSSDRAVREYAAEIWNVKTVVGG